MSDESSSTSSSQLVEDHEGELDEEVDSEEGKNQTGRGSPTPSTSSFASLRAVIRIKQKYQAIKKRRQEMALGLGATGGLTGAPGRTSPKIFTFDGLTPTTFPGLPCFPQKKKRRRKRRVLFPNDGPRKTVPKQERSRATYCLYLLFAIVFVQVNHYYPFPPGGGLLYTFSLCIVFREFLNLVIVQKQSKELYLYIKEPESRIYV